MKSKSISVISISDLHFNSCYDPSLISKLEAAPDVEWEAIFESSSIKSLSSYGEDTNYPLLKSFLNRIGLCREAEFAVFAGDFLGHSLRSHYEQAIGDTSMAGYELFITKTFRFLVSMFCKYLPGKTIYPALGNDDNFDGDYKIAPDGAFLAMVQEAWQPILSLPPGFKEGGYYSAAIPGLENNRLIVINNTFMSTRYPAPGSRDEGHIQVKWLAKELRERSGENIWLMFHEPLGINIYPTIRNGDYSDPGEVDIFLKNIYYTPLISELKNMGDKVKIILSGHTHMDSFRLLHSDDGSPLIYNHITPAVSPIFGNNPAFQLLTVDTKSNFPIDFVTIFLDLNSAHPGWKNEYTFSSQYDVPIVTPSSMYEVWEQIGKSCSLQADYKKLYDVSHGHIPDKNWKVYYQTMSEIAAQRFAQQFKKKS